MSQPWRILFTGKNRGAYNMAIDAAVLKAVEERRSPPTLRFYGWEPYCVSLGYFQKPTEEFDAAALQERGWDFVLRATGGRAVLHAEEITYSLIARRDEAPWCATLGLSFDRIAQALAQALDGFGLAIFRPGVGAIHELPLRRGPGLPCFASTSRAELAFGERKVVGSAQRRTREAFLQHGSIPMTPKHERLVEVLQLSEGQRAAYLEALQNHAISLSEIQSLPSGGLEEQFPKLAKVMLQVLKESGEVGFLTQQETDEANELEKTHLRRQAAFFKEAKRVIIPS